MEILTSTKSIDKLSADALVVFVLQDKPSGEEKLADKFLAGQIQRLRKLGDLTGETGQIKTLIGPENLPRFVLVGLGKVKELHLDRLRAAASNAVTTLKSLPVKNAAILFSNLPKIQTAAAAQELAAALSLSAYEFSEYKHPDSRKKITLEKIELLFSSPHERRLAEKAVTAGQITAKAVNIARDLGNHPANVATPSHLAEHALRLGHSSKNVKVKILHRDEIKKERMGGLLGVAKGSDEEPKFIILECQANKKSPTVVLVGKGITFDSGGISIKPSEKMEEMKYDMTGGAAVMAAIKAVSELKLPINVIGLIPTTENLPSGKALKPGDIITSRNGKTIEVVNTDAEGRLILADALDYAKKYKPDLVIDLATLTGSIVVALGDDLMGAFTNNQKWLDKLLAAARATGEKIWPMPLMPDYEQFLKSDFADLRNQSTMRYGDAIHAANFLQNFVDYPWIHLDIAAVGWTTREKPYRPKGATGAAIRMLVEFLRNFRGQQRT